MCIIYIMAAENKKPLNKNSFRAIQSNTKGQYKYDVPKNFNENEYPLIENNFENNSENNLDKELQNMFNQDYNYTKVNQEIINLCNQFARKANKSNKSLISFIESLPINLVNFDTIKYIENFLNYELENNSKKKNRINIVTDFLIKKIFPDLPEIKLQDFPNVPTYIPSDDPIVFLIKHSKIKTKNDFKKLNREILKIFINQTGFTKVQKEYFNKLLKSLFIKEILNHNDVQDIIKIYTGKKNINQFGGTKISFKVIGNNSQKISIYKCNKPKEAFYKGLKKINYDRSIVKMNVIDTNTKKVYGPYYTKSYIDNYEQNGGFYTKMPAIYKILVEVLKENNIGKGLSDEKIKDYFLKGKYNSILKSDSIKITNIYREFHIKLNKKYNCINKSEYSKIITDHFEYNTIFADCLKKKSTKSTFGLTRQSNERYILIIDILNKFIKDNKILNKKENNKKFSYNIDDNITERDIKIFYNIFIENEFTWKYDFYQKNIIDISKKEELCTQFFEKFGLKYNNQIIMSDDDNYNIINKKKSNIATNFNEIFRLFDYINSFKKKYVDFLKSLKEENLVIMNDAIYIKKRIFNIYAFMYIFLSFYIFDVSIEDLNNEFEKYTLYIDKPNDLKNYESKIPKIPELPKKPHISKIFDIYEESINILFDIYTPIDSKGPIIMYKILFQYLLKKILVSYDKLKINKKKEKIENELSIMENNNLDLLNELYYFIQKKIKNDKKKDIQKYYDIFLKYFHYKFESNIHDNKNNKEFVSNHFLKSDESNLYLYNQYFIQLTEFYDWLFKLYNNPHYNYFEYLINTGYNGNTGNTKSISTRVYDISPNLTIYLIFKIIILKIPINTIVKEFEDYEIIGGNIKSQKESFKNKINKIGEIIEKNTNNFEEITIIEKIISNFTINNGTNKFFDLTYYFSLFIF